MTRKILFVDDQEMIHQSLRRLLERDSYQLISAYNGQEAIDKAEKELPNLILLDINMPEKNGYEVMREIRKNQSTRNIPVIMLTGNGDIVDRMVGYELGVEDYLTKPFRIQELKRHIESFLKD